MSCKTTPAIKVYTRTGELVRTLSPIIDGQQRRYREIDVDEAGNLYVSAPALQATVKLSPMGEYLQGFGPQNLPAEASLSSFTGATQVDRAGNVYLVDCNSGIVYIIDAAGSWTGAVGPFYLPDGLKVDDDGMLYVGMPFQVGFVALAPSLSVESLGVAGGSGSGARSGDADLVGGARGSDDDPGGAPINWDVSLLDGKHRLILSGWGAQGNRASASVDVILVHGAAYAEIEDVGPLTLPSPPAGGEGSTNPSPSQGEGWGEGGLVSGAVEVLGTAVAPSITSFVLEASPDGEIWTEVATGTTTVTHGVLGTWDTTALGDGDHHLRLRVLDAAAPEAADTALVPLDNLPPTVAIDAPGAVRTLSPIIDGRPGEGAAPETWVEAGGTGNEVRKAVLDRKTHIA